MSWDEEYNRLNKPWGEQPSELAVLAVEYLQKNASVSTDRTVLDIGCGYGRDSLYLNEKLGFKVSGIDSAPKAIELANSARDSARHKNVSFSCANFLKFPAKRCDILYASNVYQLLQVDERKEFRDKVMKMLKHNGLFSSARTPKTTPSTAARALPIPRKPIRSTTGSTCTCSQARS